MHRISRREVVAGSALLLPGCAARMAHASPSQQFIRREARRFVAGNDPYFFTGTNMWHAAYLGSDAPFGNQARLKRELDRLTALGVTNIRILGSSELSPLKNSVAPAFRTKSAEYNETLLRGLDFALAEMGRRGMHAVIYLTNFWEWSGGMMTYLYWTNGGRYIDMNDPAHPWPEFADMVAQFYSSVPAMRLYQDYVRAIVGRKNVVTSVRYADDPTIMTWQLANEPRPGGSDAVGLKQLPAYLAWIKATSGLIRSLDPNHMISTGSEGTQGCLDRDECVLQAHSAPDIDYLTAHIWPENWGWADRKDLAGTWPTVEERTRQYIARQVAIANRLGKPLVIEEFGFPRDGDSFDPETPTEWRDRLYSLIHDAAMDSRRDGGPIAGTNFWAWGGEGRAQHESKRFAPGDTNYVGDPPHEPQGWYSVFDGDASTQALIRSHAAAFGSRSRAN